MSEFDDEMSFIEAALAPPQSISWDPITRTFTTSAFGAECTITLPPNYPNNETFHLPLAIQSCKGVSEEGVLRESFAAHPVGSPALFYFISAFRSHVEERYVPPPPTEETATSGAQKAKKGGHPPVKGSGGSKSPVPAAMSKSPPPQPIGGKGAAGGKSTPPPVSSAPLQKGKKGQPVPTPVVEESLTPSDRVYNRLMWDPSFQAHVNNFEVGYEDRFLGTQWVALTKFRTGKDETKEVPFHRVTLFRHLGKEIIWDRSARIDKCDELADRLSAMQGGGNEEGTQSLSEGGGPASVEMLKHMDPLLVIPCSHPRGPALPARYVAMTWNVLFDCFDDDENDYQSAARVPLQMKVFETCDADVICLQEITASFAEKLYAHPYIQKHYFATQLLPKARSGQVILSRYPIAAAHAFKFSEKKHAVLGVIPCTGGPPLTVVNVHLLSDHAKDSASRRMLELTTLTTHFFPSSCSETANAMLMGDFNFGDMDPEEREQDWSQLVDCWHSTHPIEEPGYTMDPIHNPLAKISCTRRKEPRRLDKIKLCGALLPLECSLFANVPNASGLFPSDHYAVRAVIMRQGGQVLPYLPGAEVDPKWLVVIIPPPSLWQPLDDIRKEHDKAYPRWMPHITLLHSFMVMRGDGADVIAQALSTLMSRVEPFQIQLQKFHHNPSHQRSWVHLVAEAQAPHQYALERTYLLLSQTYPICVQNAFAPHLTLGQFPTKEAEQFVAAIEPKWKPISFQVTHVHVVARNSAEGYVNVVHSIPLGARSVPQPFPSPLESIPFRDPDDISTDNMVMEPPQFGNKELEVYAPKDSLERWMLSVTDVRNARSCPSHISQLGGMYHVPSHLLVPYLNAWKKALTQGEAVPFFVEEVRGSTFRLYVDVDVKRSVPEPFNVLQETKFLQLLQSTVLEFFPECDPTVCVTNCHGEWEDKQNTSVKAKSGYRFYFQYVFVQSETYRKFLTELSARSMSLPPIPHSVDPWYVVVDTHALAWDRGRLFGTIKRRRHLLRRYSFVGVYGKDGGVRNDFKDMFEADIRRLLYSTTLRVWDETTSANPFNTLGNSCSSANTF